MRRLAIAVFLMVYSAQAQAINLSISGGNTVAGGSLQFAVQISGISAGGAPVNNAQLDILFDTNVFYPPADARQACQITPRLAQLTHTETLPASPPAPSGWQRLRLSAIDTIPPLGDITDGDFYFCVLDVREDAPSGTTSLQGTRQNVGDTSGNILPTAVGTGVVTVAGDGAADAIQPHGGGAPVGGAPAVDIPAPAPASGNRQGQPADTSKSGRQGYAGAGGQAATPVGSNGESQATPEAGARGDTLDAARQGAAPGAQRAQNAASATVEATKRVVTPSPKASEAVTPKGTATKVVAPTKKAESAKAAEAPTAEEKSGGCQVVAPSDQLLGILPLMVGAILWIGRRRSV